MLRVAHRDKGRSRCLVMRFVTTRNGAPPISFAGPLLEGLAPDGGLYVPEKIEYWSADEIGRLRNQTLTEIGYRTLRPYARGDVDATPFEGLVVAALNF